MSAKGAATAGISYFSSSKKLFQKANGCRTSPRSPRRALGFPPSWQRIGNGPSTFRWRNRTCGAPDVRKWFASRPSGDMAPNSMHLTSAARASAVSAGHRHRPEMRQLGATCRRFGSTASADGRRVARLPLPRRDCPWRSSTGDKPPACQEASRQRSRRSRSSLHRDRCLSWRERPGFRWFR